MKIDRRKRLKRPLLIVLFGLYFLVLPFVNYFSFAYAHDIYWTYPKLVLTWLHPAEFTLLVLAIPVGIGLLLVKKWGWYSFLVYAVAFILFDTIAFILKPIAFNLMALGNSVIGFAAVFYFTRKNISTPYLKLYPRGWRYERRTPIQIQLLLNGIECTTRDFSRTGFYVSGQISLANQEKKSRLLFQEYQSTQVSFVLTKMDWVLRFEIYNQIKFNYSRKSFPLNLSN